MFPKEAEKKLVKLPSTPNLGLVFGIGFFILSILVFSTFIARHLRDVHRPKIDSLEAVKLDVVNAYLDEEARLNVANTTPFLTDKPYFTDAKTILNSILLNVGLEDSFLPLYTTQQRVAIETIIQKIDRFKVQSQKKESSLDSKINRNKVYKDLINGLNILQNSLNKRFSSQKDKLDKTQIFNILLLILYLIFSFLMAKRYDRLKRVFLKTQKENLKIKDNVNYFLEESQNISKLGYYIYNFDTKIWKASKTITNILDLEKEEGFLKAWINLIHPDDKHILTGVVNKRQEDSSYPLDIIYRIVTLNNKIRWIHHIEQPVKKDEQGNLLPVLGVIQEITKQKEIELALFSKTQFLEKSLSQTPLAFIYFDTNSIIRMWNNGAENIFGYTAKEAVGKNIMDLIVPNDIRKKIEIVRDAIFEESGGRINQNENITKSGKRIICKWYNSEIKDINNKVIGLTSLVEDITESIMLKASLVAREKELVKSQQIANLGSYVLDITKDIWRSSPVLDKVFGIDTKYDRTVEGWLAIVHPEDSDVLRDYLINNIIKNREVFDKEYRIKRVDDRQERWVHGLGELVLDDKGEPVEMIGTIQDITEGKLAEQKLIKAKEEIEESENKFRELYEKSGDAILIIKNGIFIDCNRATITMLKYESKKDFLNLHPSKLSPELQLDGQKSFEKAEKMMKIALKNGTHRFEWMHVKSSGEVFPVEVLLTAISNEPGNKVIHCVWRDITERKIAELALKESEHKLQEAQDITRLGTFIYDDITKTFESSQILDEIVGIDQSYNKDVLGWINLVHPDYHKQLQQLFDDINLVSISEEFKIIRPSDKKIIWVLGHAKKEYDNGGKRKLITGTLQDITTRKESEEKLRQSDAILNKLNSLVVVNNGQSNIIYVSPSVKQILGYNPDELLGQGWWDLTYDSVQEAKTIQEATHKYVYNNGPKTNKVAARSIKTKNGDYKYIEWHISKGVGNSYINIGIDATKTREKDLQFKKLTETAHSAIVLTNDKGLIIEWNNAAVKLFGYQRQEVLGQPIHLIIPKKYRKKHDESLAKANKQGFLKESSIRRLNAKNKEGKIFPIELSLNTWKSNGKQIFCTFINDISQREYEARIKEVIYNITKYAQNSLKLEHLLHFIRESLNKVIDTSNFYVALYDSKSQTFNSPYRIDLEVADKYNYLHHFPKEKSFSGYVIDTQKPFLSISSFEKSLIKKGIVSEIGIKSKCWLGVPLTVEQDTIGVMVVQSYTNEKAFSQKDVVLLELVATNISRVIKQSQNYQQIQLLNQALIQSPESVIVTNLKGEIEYVNPAFTVLGGYSEEEALGQTPRLLKSDDQPKEYYKKLWESISAGNTWEGEFVNKRKDGGKYLVAATISAVKNREGIITHYIGVEEDITEKRRLEHDFINAFINAQEQEKQSFGQDLHDGISQILTAEAMYIDILINQKKVSDKDKEKFLLKIKDLNLNAINDARRIAHGLMSKQLKQNGLLKAIEHICIDYNNTKNIAFNYNSKDLKEEEISNAIKTNIFRITQEISTNIIRYSGASKADISLSKTSKNRLRLLIKDNGRGIDLDEIKHKNAGVGLKNIERRVTLLNGKFNLESTPNKGVKFTIEVPLENIQ